MRQSQTSVVTIGNFDGVHVGHRALVRRASEARSRLSADRVLALTFDPHPATVLRPESAPGRLTTLQMRRELLLDAGADEVLALRPTPDLLSRSPESFMEGVVRDHGVVGIVEGADFRFGRERVGDASLLETLGDHLGFSAEILDPVEASLVDQLVVVASSSLVRWLLSHGRARDAARLLGRPHVVRGVVVEGDKRGRDLGYPTANLECETLPPGDGVYAATATTPGGTSFPAALSVGTKPTFSGRASAVEAHLIGWDGPLDEYGWRCDVSLLRRLRDQARYATVEELVEQISRDCARAARAAQAVFDDAHTGATA